MKKKKVRVNDQTIITEAQQKAQQQKERQRYAGQGRASPKMQQTRHILGRTLGNKADTTKQGRCCNKANIATLQRSCSAEALPGPCLTLWSVPLQRHFAAAKESSL